MFGKPGMAGSLNPLANSEEQTRKVTVDLDERQLQALRWIAQQKGIKMSQALKQAIELEGYLLDKREQGARIIVEDRWGRKEELLP